MHRVASSGPSGEAVLWLYKGYEIYREGPRAWSVIHSNSPSGVLMTTFSRRACAAYIDNLDRWTMEDWVDFWAGFYEADG
jgi:hypothetical protein